jgi:hypothetical protein
MAIKKESDIQRDICHYLEKQGYVFWRFSPETYNAKLGIHLKHRFIPSGLPDIMLIDRENYGQLVGLEVKQPKGKKSPAQLLMQKRFHLNNARYEFVTSVEDVKKLGL